jgi:hypothetical protein
MVTPRTAHQYVRITDRSSRRPGMPDNVLTAVGPYY